MMENTILCFKSVYAMMNVALLAKNLIDAEEAMRIEKDDLNMAYREFKHRHDIEFVKRGTPEWDAMMAETKGEYAAYASARGNVYRAKRKLRAAIEADTRAA